MQNLVPYLMFNGNCEEAMNFYKDIFKGEFGYLGRYSEMPGETPDEYKNRIMHIELKLPGGSLLASDYAPEIPFTCDPANSGIHLSLNFDEVDVLEDCYQKLADGGLITMAIQDTFWGDRFAMVQDKYGFNWMLSCRIEQKN